MGKLSKVKDLLDMSAKARMQRAKEQGFDTDTVYYHGTNADFDEFRVNDDGVNLVGKGVYAAPAGTASGYASDVGSSVYPLLVKGKKASFQDAADAREAIGDGWTNDSVNDWLKDRGFTHRDGRQGIVIFDHEKNKVFFYTIYSDVFYNYYFCLSVYKVLHHLYVKLYYFLSILFLDYLLS